jgi:hypothetical protein
MGATVKNSGGEFFPRVLIVFEDSVYKPLGERAALLALSLDEAGRRKRRRRGGRAGDLPVYISSSGQHISLSLYASNHENT